MDTCVAVAAAGAASVVLILGSTAFGQDATPPGTPADAPAAPTAAEPRPAESPPSTRPRPAQYSLPFQLRTIIAATAVRSDTSLAGYENASAQGGFAFVSELMGCYRVPGTGAGPGSGLAPFLKLTVVHDAAPGATTGGFAFVNPLLGALYGLSFGGGWRGGASLGVTLPVGMGGGDSPDKGDLDARTVGPVVRAEMDNSLFAVNDFALIPGVDLAYVAHRLTVQVEATLFQLWRVRGSGAQPEATKTNLTAGVHAGYFVLDVLSLGAEVRYRRWLNAPIAVDQHQPGTSVDMTSLGVGPRLHFHLSGDVWLRPALAYTRGFDPPMSSPGNDNVVQVDVPAYF